MRYIIYLTILFTFTPGLMYSQSGWVETNTGVFAQYRSIYFSSLNTGYAVGNNYAGNRVIVKTTNGGTNWQNISIPLSGTWWRTYFINDNTGFVCGSGGMIMKTTDGGVQWSLQSSGINNILWAIHFTDENTGYAGAEFGHIVKTTNGGTNWFSQTSNTSNYIESFYFFDSNTGFACGRFGTLLKTTNGGTNWIPQSMGTSKWFHDIDFGNSQTGYMAGGNFNDQSNIIVKTTNGGANWSTLINSSGFFLTGIAVPSPDTAYATALTGFILKTTNGGSDWLFQTIAANDTLDEVVFINNTTGYTGTFTGKVFKTTSGGVVTTVSQTGAEIPERLHVKQNYPNPFNPTTKISFDIPRSEFVVLEVFNTLGKRVALLVNEYLTPGSYEHNFDGSDLSSGIYFYSLKAGDVIQSRKMILLK